MNKKIIVYLLGWILNIEAAFMLLPCIVAFIYKEASGFYFMVVLLLCGGIGFLCTRKKPDNMVFLQKKDLYLLHLAGLY